MIVEKKPGCVEAAVCILGDKWTPLLLKALVGTSRGFCDVQKAAGGVNPRTLSARLNKLEAHDVIVRVQGSTDQFHAKYALTAKGQDLIPILRSMAKWGEKYGTDADK